MTLVQRMYNLGILDTYSQAEIVKFCEAHQEGDKFLESVQKQRDYQLGNKLPTSSAKASFWKLAKAHVAKEERQAYESQMAAETQREAEGYEKAIEKGWKPTRANLIALIEDLYDQGEISQQHYEWGIKGASLVHDMAGIPEPPF